MFCDQCKKELGEKKRYVKIDGKGFVFCPTSSATLATDCLNDYLKAQKIAEKRACVV